MTASYIKSSLFPFPENKLPVSLLYSAVTQVVLLIILNPQQIKNLHQLAAEGMAAKEQVREQIKISIKEPRQYQVLIYNDDFTPMVFLKKIFVKRHSVNHMLRG